FKNTLEIAAYSKLEAHEVESQANETERFMDLLKRLDLQKYYPKQMQTGDVCVVDSAMSTKHPSTEKELASSFLQKLIMVDYQARYVSVRSENEINENIPNNADTNYENFFEHDDTLSQRDGLAANTQTHIHPMDLQMTIYHCGDNFVRQYIYTKLSFCQFALPLLVPNPCSSEIEFPLWAFRQINKNWKCRGTSTNTQQTKTCAIVNADTPLVSFIRFGESPTSKSQMLNSLLSQQRHGVFFNRHCKGSSRNGLLMEGVTEVAWYCPGGRDDDVFNDCIAFTNLHGDARQHRRQVQFLHEISSINVILMSDRDLNDEAKIILQECLKSPKPLVCLWTDRENIVGGHSGTKVKIAVKNINEAELMDALKSTLNNMLANSTQTINLDDCSNIARLHGFTVDEDDEDCREGKSKADDLLSRLKVKSLSSMKETFLPLQGQLWHEWCKKDKELTRLRVKENQSIEGYRDNIVMDKQSIRRAQILKASPLNDVMKTMIENLQLPADKVIKYFLHWLKIYLDRISAECLPRLHLQYHQARREMVKFKKEKVHEKSFLDTKQTELQKISQKRDASSFGIDHLFREVGQIYEASQTLQGTVKRSAALPGIAADLMLSGFPLELMDGDASHVPLSWISSVLDKVIEKIGDKTLFVLSIVGLQSSGKSTLLNTMFGLQFPVGAGRCTRGVYMQLVKVEEEFTTELGCDFVLIVDTEGLRAPELSNSSPTHDNELATFVIGLGNATVINIFGENPSEMQDILQIAVQAFLRMKQVKLSPSCVFVHQNVDVTTQDKNEDGRASLQMKLDEMTRLAAQQEQIAVESFDEVIRFDVDSHIRYFANLWEGNPPMAPTNPVYCQNVQDLKKILLSIAKTEHNVLKISEFKARTDDLWKALLAENFVFSFKNTLEIAAYSKLEVMYGKWTWSLRSYFIQEENKQHTIINNNTDTTYDLTWLSIEQTVFPKYNEISEQIEAYFNSDDAEWLSQWKANFVKRFETIKDELVNDTYKKCTDLMKQKRSRIKLDQNRSRYEDQLIKKSKDLASKLKTIGLKYIQLEKEFNKMWDEWTHEVKKSITPPRKVNFRQLAQEVLTGHFTGESDLLAKLTNMDANEVFMFRPKEHVVIKREGVWNKVKNALSYINKQEIDIVNKITQNAKNAAREILKVLEKRKLGYNETNLHEVIHTVLAAVGAGVVAVVNDKDSKVTVTVTLTNRYRLDLAIHILANAERRFQKIEKDFQTANDPLIYLNSKKEEYFLTFKNRCKGATNTTIFADILCSKLKTALHQAVCDKASIDIAHKIKSNCRAFNGNRSNLENSIMIHLAEQEYFEEFNEYIQNPKEYFERYIKERVEEYCSAEENKNIHEIFQSCLDLHKNDVFNAITDATTAVYKSKGDASSWLDEFSKQLGDKIHVPRHSLDAADYKDIDDIVYFREELTASMTTMVVKLKEQYSKASLQDLEDVRNTPHGILCEHMSGCWVQCPFCNAICTNTIPNHDEDHSVQVHRSQAVTGWHFYGTDHFLTNVCTSSVASDRQFKASEDNFIPYKDYRTAGPEYARWSITPDLTVQPYWKWFVCRFKSDLEARHSLQFKDSGAIPEGWKTITKQDVIADLRKK
ncbi:unnamed protein product, partial [Lampetra fluviatilis]